MDLEDFDGEGEGEFCWFEDEFLEDDDEPFLSFAVEVGVAGFEFESSLSFSFFFEDDKEDPFRESLCLKPFIILARITKGLQDMVAKIQKGRKK